MKNNVVFNNQETLTVNPDEMIKVTALLYLKEALLEEQYEECAELIEIAKGFGAQKSEVAKVLIDYNCGLKGVRPDEEMENFGGRLRF